VPEELRGGVCRAVEEETGSVGRRRELRERTAAVKLMRDVEKWRAAAKKSAVGGYQIWQLLSMSASRYLVSKAAAGPGKYVTINL